MKRLISFFPNKKPSAPAKYAGAKGISSRTTLIRHDYNTKVITPSFRYLFVPNRNVVSVNPYLYFRMKLRDELYMYSNVSVLTNPDSL